VKEIDTKRIAEIEETTKHDVVAFISYIEEVAGDAARFLHFAMTSSDVLDTAFAIQLQKACDLIIKELQALLDEIEKLAKKHKKTVIIGRTHGIHAQPTSLGLIFALWFAELQRNMKRLLSAREEISVGKLSGAVGTYRHLSPEIEEKSMEILGLRPETVSNQIVQRDRHSAFFNAIALCGASIEKIALTIRHWQRTEVSEIFEPFGKGQKGSSAMPHKRNPIGCENLCGIARLLRSYAIAGMENVALWHERDISHSSVERVIGPDATTLLHYMIRRAKNIVSNLEIDTEQMKRNLEITKGLIFSEDILNKLILSGLNRQTAYTLVQRNALKSLQTKKDFFELLISDREIVERIGRKGIKEAFDIEKSLTHVDSIFKRVFENGKRKDKKLS
jgi:adenylosuccinate lyase